MADYKSHVWTNVAREVSYAGPPIELERKWRHMRDRYVRLRKVVKTTQPLKKSDKWYFYYQKMSFLDPYVEHRNRRKRGEMTTGVSSSHNDSTQCDGTFDSFDQRQDEEGSDSGEGETEINPLKDFYASFLNPGNQLLTNGGLTTEVNHKPEPGESSKPSPSLTRKRKVEEVDEDQEETEVTLFVRSIKKTLSGMDPKTFALARLEISRVLYECQFGKKQLPGTSGT